MIRRMSLRHSYAVLNLLVFIGAAPAPKTGGVVLLQPYEKATVAEGNLNGFRIKRLAAIDPDHPLRGHPDTQTFSLFGREDLIAGISDDYRPTACAPVPDGGDGTDEIVRRAGRTSIVIINESHERSEHRGFTTSLLPHLRAKGYTALALEALSHPTADTPPQFQPSVMRPSAPPYLEDEDGYYLGEGAFGRLARTAKRLGYTFVPYEEQAFENVDNLSTLDRIARREEAQANALAEWIHTHPGGKLVVHVGYHHATEVPRDNGSRWMANRLRAKSGIDPLTISQTTCRGGGPSRRLAMLPREEIAGSFDLIVDHPAARFVKGRPAWRMAAGEVPVSIPAGLRPARGWRIIEARPEGEPAAAVPMDRVAIRPSEDIALMLPPGRYRLRTIDVKPPPKAS